MLRTTNLPHLIRNLSGPLIAIAFTLISIVPFHIYGLSLFFPLVNVTVIYYWTLFHPQQFSRSVVFFLGLFHDLLYALPLGCSIIPCLVMQSLLNSKRRFLIKENFIVLWTGFTIFTVIFCFIKWFMLVIINRHNPGILLPCLQCFMTIITYPLYHWLMSYLTMIIFKKNHYA